MSCSCYSGGICGGGGTGRTGALTEGSGQVRSLVSGVQYCLMLLYKYHCRSRLNRDDGTINGKTVTDRDEQSLERILYITSGSLGSDVVFKKTFPGDDAENLNMWYFLIPFRKPAQDIVPSRMLEQWPSHRGSQQAVTCSHQRSLLPPSPAHQESSQPTDETSSKDRNTSLAKTWCGQLEEKEA